MKKILIWSAVFFVFAILESEAFDPWKAGKKEKYVFRLPNNTNPIHYDLHLTSMVHLKQSAFNGTVKIDIQVLEDTKNIVIYASRLEIVSVVILDGPLAIECNARYDENQYNQLLTITPDYGETLEAGKLLTVVIKYWGEVRGYRGFGVSSYTTKDGEERWFANMLSDKIFARKVFPCYDEPMKKATFSLSITHGSNYTAISNTEPIGNPVSHNGTDLVTTTFKTTPSISTFMTGFIVSDFVYSEIESRGIKHRVFSRPEAKDYHKFALNTSAQIIAALDDHFQTLFLGSKLDQVAVPKCDLFCNHETRALSTFREKDLLSKSDELTTHDQTKIAITIGKKNVNQWIENNASIEWWSYFWLKESLAAYYSYVLNNKVGYISLYIKLE